MSGSPSAGVPIPIDPVLLHQEALPARTDTGVLVSQTVYEAHLQTIKRKEPLQSACAAFNVRVAKAASLSKLRAALVQYWYSKAGLPALSHPSITTPQGNAFSTAHLPPTSQPSTSTQPHDADPDEFNNGDNVDDIDDAVERANAAIAAAKLQRFAVSGVIDEISPDEVDIDTDDTTLAEQYDIGMRAQMAFGTFDSGMEDAEDEELDETHLHDNETFKQFQTNVRLAAARRTESNRRQGGRKTQIAVVKCWNIFLRHALSKGLIKDNIVDEHSLLLYIDFTANRCQRNRRGEDIPNTRIGASQIKKEFFGALRIRKVQEARDPSLKIRRPATTVYVFDAARTRMDEALRNKYEGLVEGEDAPDIVANTFLDQLPDETLVKIGYGFLAHRELKPAIMGHLAWALMNASGNRGDDIRALKLCELQLYEFLHPNQETLVQSVLALQSQHKAQQKKMKTTVNPTYTAFIGHRNPEMCPLGAIAIFLHYLHDYVDIEEKYEINYALNKSWRNIYLIHGSSALVAYNESSLINLFAQAYKKAGVQSRLKQHLARHALGYRQERMGVDKAETSKLGWSRDTYNDVYAPSLAKKAILGTHGFMAHEEYTLPWRHVEVPDIFLQRVFCQAETHLATVQDKANLVGAFNYWKMIIAFRPILFQCAAAIYQACPKSSLFRLPAFLQPDVQLWMETEFVVKYTCLCAQGGSGVDLSRIQDATLRQALEAFRTTTLRQSRVIEEQAQQLALLNQKLDRRTSQWTPPKAFLADANGNTVQSISRRLSFPTNDTGDASTTLPSALGPPALIDSALRATENTGVYIADDSSPRAFIVPSPNASSLSPHPRTNIDLVLPPLIAFCNPGEDLIWPVCLGPDSADWASIFEAIKQPQLLWNEWKPARPLDHMSSSEIWRCYNDGEQVLDKAGTPTGIKPPLRSVEQHFHAAWRKEPKQHKAWQRFSVIPKWIENTTSKYSISPKTAIARLDEKRMIPSKLIPLRTNALVKLLEKEWKEISLTTSSCAPQLSPPQTPTAPVSSPMISSSAMSPVSRSLPPSSPCSSSPIQPTSSAGKRPAPAIPTHPQLKRSKTTIPVAPIVAHYDFV